MSTDETASSPQRRVLLRHRDGSLYDPDQNRSVSIEELADEIRAHHPIRIKRLETGSDCTYEVLVEILATALPQTIATDMFRDMFGASPVGSLSSLLTVIRDWTDPQDDERHHRPVKRGRNPHAQP